MKERGTDLVIHRTGTLWSCHDTQSMQNFEPVQGGGGGRHWDLAFLSIFLMRKVAYLRLKDNGSNFMGSSLFSSQTLF
jgi:hypothetical protein